MFCCTNGLAYFFWGLRLLPAVGGGGLSALMCSLRCAHTAAIPSPVSGGGKEEEERES